jgi:hypothetical protein
MLRPTFTLRDWIWFCIVIALAIGWGTHVRYTNHLETYQFHIPSHGELTGLLQSATSDSERYRRELSALNVALRKSALTELQRAEIEKKRRFYIDQPEYPY